MARKKTSKRATKSKRKTKKKTSWLDRIPEMPTGPAVTASAWVAIVAGVAAAWWLGVPRLEAAVAETATSTVDGAGTIVFSERPRWVDDELLASLEQLVRDEITGDPFAQEDLVRAHAALLDTGWFDRVDQVRRVNAIGEEKSPGVAIDVHFARPFAVVRDRDGDHLIDASGRRLPRSFRTTEGPEELAVITGAHFPRSEPGDSWRGADLTAALNVMKLIDMRPWSGQIAQIDLDSRDAEIVLITDVGARIIWGSAPGQEAALEPTEKRKLAFLDKAYESRGRVDSSYAGVWRFYQDVLTAE
jgi:hypothetical protein